MGCSWAGRGGRGKAQVRVLRHTSKKPKKRKGPYQVVHSVLELYGPAPGEPDDRLEHRPLPHNHVDFPEREPQELVPGLVDLSQVVTGLCRGSLRGRGGAREGDEGLKPLLQHLELRPDPEQRLALVRGVPPPPEGGAALVVLEVPPVLRGAVKLSRKLQDLALVPVALLRGRVRGRASRNGRVAALDRPGHRVQEEADLPVGELQAV